MVRPAGARGDAGGHHRASHKETVAVLQSAESRQRLASDGAEVVAGSPAEFAAFMRTETVKWAQVVKAAGIQPE